MVAIPSRRSTRCYGQETIREINPRCEEVHPGQSNPPFTCCQAVFRFGDTDAKLATKTLKRHDDELSRVLKETVPGLVTAPAETVSNALAVIGMDDRAGAGQHRILIKPDAFHVSVLFQPTLIWLDHVLDALPSSASVYTAEAHTILDDFVQNVYLPQLEEKVLSLFHDAVTGPDAFREDSAWRVLSKQPVVRVRCVDPYLMRRS